MQHLVAISPVSAQGFLAIEAMDFRKREGLVPVALLIYEALKPNRAFQLKEIIVVCPESEQGLTPGQELKIVHRYWLVFERK